MKNKFTYATLIIFVFAAQFFAQESVQHLKNGLTVAVMSKTIPPLTNPKESSLAPLLQMDFDDDTKILRSILDTQNKLSYDYSLEVIPETNSSKYKVKFKLENQSFISKLKDKLGVLEIEAAKPENKNLKAILETPISLLKEYMPMFQNYQNKPLPKYPNEVLVSDGDTIVLDILEDAKTGAKVQDLIRVTRENKAQGYFADLAEPKNFTLNDVQLNLVDFQVFENENLVYPVLQGQPFQQSANGSQVILMNAKGQFLISPIKRDDLKLEQIGIIEDNKLYFTYNGNKYKIVSKSPILGKTGKWNLWIGFKPKNENNKIEQMLTQMKISTILLAGDELDQKWNK